VCDFMIAAVWLMIFIFVILIVILFAILDGRGFIRVFGDLFFGVGIAVLVAGFLRNGVVESFQVLYLFSLVGGFFLFIGAVLKFVGEV